MTLFDGSIKPNELAKNAREAGLVEQEICMPLNKPVEIKGDPWAAEIPPLRPSTIRRDTSSDAIGAVFAAAGERTGEAVAAESDRRWTHMTGHWDRVDGCTYCAPPAIPPALCPCPMCEANRM